MSHSISIKVGSVLYSIGSVPYINTCTIQFILNVNVVPTGCMESYPVMSYYYYTSVVQSVASGIPATCPEDLWEETEVSRTVWYMKTPDLDETDSSSKSQSDVLQLSETVSESVRIL